MRNQKTSLLLTTAICLAIASQTIKVAAKSSALESFDTGYTITKIRSGLARQTPFLVASSYEGTLLAMKLDGTMVWRQPLSGFMNHDLWCADLTGNGFDEILAANADGTIYCLNHLGKLQWKFKPNDAPMYAVSVIKAGKQPYVVCGGYDTNYCYLNNRGKLVKTIASATYSQQKPWGKPGGKRLPKKNRHITNFLRPVRGPNGEEILAVHGALISMATSGSMYFFKPLEEQPFQTIEKLPGGKPYGDFSVSDINQDGVDEITLGTSTAGRSSAVLRVDLKNNKQHLLQLAEFNRKIGGFGYRVAQTVRIGNAKHPRFLTAFGSHLVVSPPDFDKKKLEFLTCQYSFNDLWREPKTGKILLASAQSGGSCVHVLDTSHPRWQDDYRNLQPQGKLKALLENTATARKQLQRFQRPSHERKPKPVYLMTESLSGHVEKLALSLESRHGSPVFLAGKHMPKVENWDRREISSPQYRARRDQRKKYTLTPQQALDQILPLYDLPRQGVSFWGGHGNDPYMFSADTLKKVVDRANGKKSVFIYPELEHYDDAFALVLQEHFYPLAKYFQSKNTHIYVRTKHSFWQAVVYLPLWSRLLSGEFADVFIPSMEETTDKSMEQTVAGRVGIWASGAVNQWGSRAARDNTSFDRLRQHSHQTVPNHFLRTQIYNLSYGATYQNNFPVDQGYFSILYELIAKGAIFVPARHEVVSFNPVHLSMLQPDERYLDEGHNVKWLTFYDAAAERNNPLVFSRLNGTWPGAPVTDWDFSRYAADVKDRRLHFLPPYPNGLVLITPPQHGKYADQTAPRGALTDHLHPLYQNILQEYLTDGRNYLSADGSQTYAADKYYQTVEAAIKSAARKLPLTVTGNVAWAAAQTSPTHLRLTLIDSGYINPSPKTATVKFHTVRPMKMTDLLNSETFSTADSKSVDVPVPCGLFRFLDIELSTPFIGEKATDDNARK